ncbi:pyridoxal phosphate-dependent decarboxylase family protein [Paracidovorax oryzae]|uniref:pyridoxal phosphate-dependent decarboxylase family protein n=1 Tax=Paracidovorax oryzae TaxID=862720 RepID=UPI0009FF231E|nr:aspartate aminotransferase family protein [Paracidovorax oryzae]
MTESWKEHFIRTGCGGADRYRAVMATCVEELSSLFESATRPYSGREPSDLRGQVFRRDLGVQAVAPLEQVIREVRQDIAAHAIIVQHPHCIAHLHTPPLLSGIAAESFIAAQNLSMDSWDQSGSATFVEQRVVEHLCTLFGYPPGADGVFTSGGTQGNIMALLTARDWFLWTHHGHQARRDGMPDFFPRLRIIASAKSHFTVDKAAFIMGLGQRGVVKVRTGNDGAIDMDELASTVESLRQEGLLPFAVVGTAGTTDHGAIDDLQRIGEISRAHGLWFHVDGAYGSALVLGRHRHRLAGIEQADSMVADFHKLWFQPVSCGALLFREGERFRHLLYQAEYLNRETDDLPNLVDKTISTTRRFDALKVYMMLRAVGTEVLGEMIDHLLGQAREVAEAIRRRSMFELLAEPSLTTILFRYTGPVPGTDIDAFNRRLRAGLLKHGIAVLGETTVQQRAALKLTLLNPCLAAEDFDSLLDNIAAFAARDYSE